MRCHEKSRSNRSKHASKVRERYSKAAAYMIPKNGLQFTDIHESNAPAFFHTMVLAEFSKIRTRKNNSFPQRFESTVLCYPKSNKLPCRAEIGWLQIHTVVDEMTTPGLHVQDHHLLYPRIAVQGCSVFGRR